MGYSRLLRHFHSSLGGNFSSPQPIKGVKTCLGEVLQKQFPTGVHLGISCQNNEDHSQTSAEAFCRLAATPSAPRVTISAAQLQSAAPAPPGYWLSIPKNLIQGPFFLSLPQHGAKCVIPLLWQEENLLPPLERSRERNYEIQFLQTPLKVVFQRHLPAHELFLWNHV